MDDNLASSNAPRHGAIPSLIYRHSSMPPPSETDWDSTFGTSRRRMDGVYAKRWTGLSLSRSARRNGLTSKYPAGNRKNLRRYSGKPRCGSAIHRTPRRSANCPVGFRTVGKIYFTHWQRLPLCQSNHSRNTTLVTPATRTTSSAKETLIAFTARDNPKVRDGKAEGILDDGVIRELDESVFIKWFGLK